MELFAAKPVANSKGTASMSHKISRRTLLQTLCSGTAAGILAPQLPGFSNVRESKQEGNGSRAAMFRIARAFMNKYEVPGLSVSITRHGKFVYEHQFGMADQGAGPAVASQQPVPHRQRHQAHHLSDNLYADRKRQAQPERQSLSGPPEFSMRNTASRPTNNTSRTSPWITC